MSSALSNRTTADAYTAANTLACAQARRVNLVVANAAIYYQLGRGAVPRYEQPEAFLIPGVYSLDRICDAVRVRSAKAGVPAQVSIEALVASEVG